MSPRLLLKSLHGFVHNAKTTPGFKMDHSLVLDKRIKTQGKRLLEVQKYKFTNDTRLCQTN